MLSNPATFVTNGGHQYDEGDELNLLVPKTAGGLAGERRIDTVSFTAFSRTNPIVDRGILTTEKLLSLLAGVL